MTNEIMFRVYEQGWSSHLLAAPRLVQTVEDTVMYAREFCERRHLTATRVEVRPTWDTKPQRFKL